MITRTIVLATVLILLGGPAASAQDKPASAPAAPGSPAPGSPELGSGAGTASRPAIEQGSTVQLEYTVSLEDGEVVDSNRGRDPLTVTQGSSEIIAGLEAALDGMRAGEAKRVTVKPEDAYGPVDPAAELEVAKDRVPPDVAVGAQLAARNSTGQVRVVRVKEIKAETVVLDLNHPLAGKTLHFDVKILDVKAPAR